MNSIPRRSRTLLVSAALATAAALAPIGVPAVVAEPASPGSGSVSQSPSFATWCRTSLDGFDAELRRAGLGAQAAKNAAEITRIECQSVS